MSEWAVVRASAGRNRRPVPAMMEAMADGDGSRVGMDAETYFRDGLRLAAAGDLGGAFVAFEKAVELHPGHGAACKELAKLALLANEKRAFTNWCHEAMRVDEADAEPHLLMAEALADAHRWDEAVDELEAALSRAMDADQVRRADRVQRVCHRGRQGPG